MDFADGLTAVSSVLFFPVQTGTSQLIMFQVARSELSLPVSHLVMLCPDVTPEPPTRGPSCGKTGVAS